MTREEAIKIIDCYDIGFYDLSGEKIPADKLADAFDMAIEALKAKTDGDIISRQGALAKIRTRLQDWAAYGNEEYRRGLYACEDMILSLPSAEPKTGEWIPNHDGSWNCSECGLRVFVYAKGNFCPNCGADMRGKQE